MTLFKLIQIKSAISNSAIIAIVADIINELLRLINFKTITVVITKKACKV